MRACLAIVAVVLLAAAAVAIYRHRPPDGDRAIRDDLQRLHEDLDAGVRDAYGATERDARQAGRAVREGARKVGESILGEPPEPSPPAADPGRERPSHPPPSSAEDRLP